MINLVDAKGTEPQIQSRKKNEARTPLSTMLLQLRVSGSLLFLLTLTLTEQTVVTVVRAQSDGGSDYNKYGELQKNLTQARQLWDDNGSDDYLYEIDHNCFCVECALERRKVRVDGNGVTSVSYASGQAKEECEDELPLNDESEETISSLFNQLQEWIDEDVYRLTASFHDSLGYPDYVTVEESEEVSDTYSEYTIHCLTISFGGTEAKYHDKCETHHLGMSSTTKVSLSGFRIARRHRERESVWE